ncbi:MAG: restriction endonuclease subunit S [Candidatus Omnitrophica bacterium]|nr:restriction endonuclease subunit S [Candidatus Omnitrophota bacterium]
MIKFRRETEFKETEIGEIPRDWEVSEIGEFYNLKYGITLSSLNYGNCRLLRQTDLKEGEILIENIPYSMAPEDKIEPYSLKPDDLVISRIANIGTVGYISKKYLDFIDKPLLFGSYLLKFEKIKKINNKFTFYFLASSQMQEYIKSIGEGSTRANTNAKVVGKFPLVIPPLPEQSRIATVLSYFDDLIENKKRQNEILEKTAMAIFKNWFIDFEPFKDGEFVDSELGKIPKGWEVKKLKNFAYITMGQSPPSYAYNELGLGNPFIQGKGQFGKYTPQTNVYCSVAGKKCQERDILLTVRAPVGELNIVDQEYIIGRGVASLRTNYWCYLFLFLSSSNEKLKSYERGTTYEAITKEELEIFPILSPPPPILQKFHSLVEPLFQKIILNQKQIMLLRKIRDKLLPLLVFGKLRVEEI